MELSQRRFDCASGRACVDTQRRLCARMATQLNPPHLRSVRFGEKCMTPVSWTLGNTIAALALFISSLSFLVSFYSHRLVRAEKRRAELSAVILAPLPARAARRAAHNLRASVICTANDPKLVAGPEWDEIGVYLRAFKEALDSAKGLSSLLKGPELMSRAVLAGLTAHRHASEMRDQANTISQKEWIEKQAVLIKSLESARRRFSRFLVEK